MDVRQALIRGGGLYSDNDDMNGYLAMVALGILV